MMEIIPTNTIQMEDLYIKIARELMEFQLNLLTMLKLFQTEVKEQYSLALDGSNKFGSFFLSYSHLDEKGVVH